MLSFRDLQNSIEYGLTFLVSHSVSFAGHEISFIEILVIVVILLVFLDSFTHRKRKPWRIAASKKWLKSFRANKKVYSRRKRFSDVRDVDHFLWEDILMSCFEERGYPIVRTKMTWDGGSDGFVTINGELIVIQAKRYKGPISKSHVMELDNMVFNSKRLNKGLFIHTGKTSAPIKKHFRMCRYMGILSGVDPILRMLDGEEISLFGHKLNKPKGMR